MIAELSYDAEVEYLGFTGTQWIDTGIAPTEKTGVECSIFWTTTNLNMNPFGVLEDLPGGRTRFMLQIYESALPNVFFGTSTTSVRGGTGAGAWNDISLAKGKYVNNGINVSTVSYSPFSFNRHLICGGYGSSSITNHFVGRMRYFRIMNNDALVRDFIPVRFTNESGQTEGAMYDRVTKKLFRNSGTGSFIIGPDVAKPVMGLNMYPDGDEI